MREISARLKRNTIAFLVRIRSARRTLHIYLCLSLCMSLYVCLSLCLYLSQSLSLCFSLSVCLCVCVSVCVSVSLLWYDFDTSLSPYAYLVGLIALATERTFSRFIFLMKILLMYYICGVGVTYKMVWSKYQNCIRYVSYVTYHTHTYIYICILVHSAHTTVPHSFMLMSAFA